MNEQTESKTAETAQDEAVGTSGLLPCPFCGKQPRHTKKASSAVHPGNFWPESIECAGCGIFFCCNNVVAFWNTRAR